MINITYDQAKLLYETGLALVKDDASDIGWLTYKNRRLHRYHGKKAPDHESPFHHWQIGTILMLIGQFGGALAMAQEAHQAFIEEEQKQELELQQQYYQQQQQNNQQDLSLT